MALCPPILMIQGLKFMAIAMTGGSANSPYILFFQRMIYLMICCLFCVSFRLTAEEVRADYDIDDDGLIEINNGFDLMAITPTWGFLSSTLHGQNSGCPEDFCRGFELSQDIDMAVEPTVYQAPGLWLFGQFFEGNGHTISNFRQEWDSSMGLFEAIWFSTIQNVTLDGDQALLSGVTQIGGLVDRSESSQVINCTVNIPIHGFAVMGGIIANAQNSAVINSRFTGSMNLVIPHSNVGGIIGLASNSLILASAMTGERHYDYEHIANYPVPDFFGFASRGSKIIASYAHNMQAPTDPIRGMVYGGTFMPLDNDSWATYYTMEATYNLIKPSSLATIVTRYAEVGESGVSFNELFTGVSEQLDCATAQGDCPNGDVFAGWQDYTDSNGKAIWNFADSYTLPTLQDGLVFSNLDQDSDYVVDLIDAFPNNAAAFLDYDQDGYPDDWHSLCDSSCQENSGLILDEYLNNPMAQVASPDPEVSAGAFNGYVFNLLILLGLIKYTRRRHAK